MNQNNSTILQTTKVVTVSNSINDNKFKAFKINKPKPYYRQYYLYTLSIWFLCFIATGLLLSGVIMLTLIGNKKVLTIIGTVLLMIGLQLPIMLGLHLGKKELFPQLLKQEYNLRKRYEQTKVFFFIPVLFPLLGALLMNKLLKKAVCSLYV